VGGRVKVHRILPKSVHLYAIRELRPHPQIASTSRHISQGGIDLKHVTWSAETRTLHGESEVVAGDPYVLTVHVPAGYSLVEVDFDGQTAKHKQDGQIAIAAHVPEKTRHVSWRLRFEK